MRSASIFLLLCMAAMLLGDANCQRNARSSCPCLKTTNTVLRKENILSYKRQTAGVCHIDAIVFTTGKNTIVCSDPRKLWVKKAVEYLDNKKKPVKPTARPVNSTSTLKTTLGLNTGSQRSTAKNCKN
nr:chemokine (C-X-C motif) ligand 32b, duplicate 1 [Misgurnus anguillicaudatus]